MPDPAIGSDRGWSLPAMGKDGGMKVLIRMPSSRHERSKFAVRPSCSVGKAIEGGVLEAEMPSVWGAIMARGARHHPQTLLKASLNSGRWWLA